MIGGRLTDGMASSEATGRAFDNSWPSVTRDVIGGVIALDTIGLTEARSYGIRQGLVRVRKILVG
jgi:hypothetical protein